MNATELPEGLDIHHTHDTRQCKKHKKAGRPSGHPANSFMFTYLQFPGESGSSEDCRIGLLELGEDNLHLVSPQREYIGVHGPLYRLAEEILGPCETAEENDCLRGAECYEVGERLAENGSGESENLESQLVSVLGCLIDILGSDVVETSQ